MLSPLIFLFPSLYGEGYDSLRLFIEGKTEADWMQIMSGSMFAEKSNFLLLYVGLVVMTKVFATSATNGAGGCGGTFAPSLFIGGFGGFFFARFWNMEQLGVYIPEKNFTLYGMAAVMSAVMHAPFDGYLPDCRTDRRLSTLYPIDYCDYQFLSYDKYLRTS